MKLKIKVKVLTKGCMPVISEKGDWIDLRAAEQIKINAPQSGTLKTVTQGDVKKCYRDVELSTTYIPLGVAIQLPKGFEAIVASRSSAPKNLKVLIPGGIGIIDNCYNGNTDEWKFICSSMGRVCIDRFSRVCQFRIQLSQKATVWQKLKWLLSSGIKLVEVDNLSDNNRGGFGSSGVK